MAGRTNFPIRLWDGFAHKPYIYWVGCPMSHCPKGFFSACGKLLPERPVVPFVPRWDKSGTRVGQIIVVNAGLKLFVPLSHTCSRLILQLVEKRNRCVHALSRLSPSEKLGQRSLKPVAFVSTLSHLSRFVPLKGKIFLPVRRSTFTRTILWN